MKPRCRSLGNLLIGLSALASTVAFGEATEIWTNALGSELGAATNWLGGLPSTANNDTGEFNGAVPGNLSLVYNLGTLASGFGSSAINLYLNAAQTGAVSISTTVPATSSPLAIDDITIDSGAGSFTFGGQSSSSVLSWVARPADAVHTMINNSANTATLTPWLMFTAGGGATWTLDFRGTGNWQCNSYLVDNNGPPKTIEVDGPGTVFWNPTGFLGSSGLTSPINIAGGLLVLEGPHPRLNTQAITLTGNFEFNAPASAQSLSGVISSSGNLQVNAGTLTLSGASTYTGNTVLSGGELVVNGAETAGTSGPLGVGGTISFSGGTLGFTVNDTFDYSPRFSTAAAQAFSFDTGGQDVVFTNTAGLSSSGGTLTKLGSGTLTLGGANTYTGTTTVSVGKLVFQGTLAGTANISVADGAALGVFENGSQITPATLTVGTSAGAALEFNNLTNTATPTIAAGSITANGPITVNVNSGVFKTIGQQFPLFSWSSGSAPAVSLGAVSGAAGTLSTNGNSIVLTITATPYVWSGGNSGIWDSAMASNWLESGNFVVFANGAMVLFDDTLVANSTVTISGVVQPASVTFANNNTNYSIISSAGNDISGSGGLTKVGSGTVTLSGGANVNTGATTVNGGLLSVGTLANGGSASDIGAANNTAASIVLNGGTLQYTGSGASSDHLFTLGTANGAIDSSGSAALVLNNAGAMGLSGTGPRILTLTGSDASGGTLLAAVVGDNGGATAVTKAGAGTWTLTGNNTYSGLTTIASGELIVGTGGASGSLGTGPVADNGSLTFDVTGTETVGAVTGTGSVTNEASGTIILAGCQ